MKAQLTLIAALIGLVLLFGVNILSANTLRSVRADLTEDRLYSLSQGTRNILGDLDEPISLTFFFSEEASNDVPTIRTYALRVRDLLEEYTLMSGGMVELILPPQAQGRTLQYA